MVMRLKRGELPKPSATVKQVAKGMSEEQARDFAKKPKTMHSVSIRHHKKKGMN
jgi:hypothetical protein